MTSCKLIKDERVKPKKIQIEIDFESEDNIEGWLRYFEDRNTYNWEEELAKILRNR